MVSPILISRDTNFEANDNPHCSTKQFESKSFLLGYMF